MAVLILAEEDPSIFSLPFHNSKEYDLKNAIAIGFDGKFFKY